MLGRWKGEHAFPDELKRRDRFYQRYSWTPADYEAVWSDHIDELWAVMQAEDDYALIKYNERVTAENRERARRGQPPLPRFDAPAQPIDISDVEEAGLPMSPEMREHFMRQSRDGEH